MSSKESQLVLSTAALWKDPAFAGSSLEERGLLMSALSYMVDKQLACVSMDDLIKVGIRISLDTSITAEAFTVENLANSLVGRGLLVEVDEGFTLRGLS